MPAKKPAKKTPRKSIRSAAASGEATGRFTAEERTAMRQRAKELKTAPSGAGSESQEGEVLAKIASMAPPDRAMGERVHAIIRSAAPELAPRLWYGMPAYARDGKVVCFFQDARKFKTRYATLGFSDRATLDDGHMWPTAYALTQLTATEEANIMALVKRAVG